MGEPRVRCAAVLAMLVVLLAVSAGCIGHDYVSNRDIVVLKLTPDGSLEWTKIVDNGFDDMAEDLVELPGGGYALAGYTADGRHAQSRPVLIRLSSDGTVASQRFATNGFDVARAVALADDGGTAVLTGNGTVVRFSSDGQVLWTRASGIPEANALVRTADGGFLAGGQIEDVYQIPLNDTARPGSDVPLPVIMTETGAGGPALTQTAEPVTTPRTLPIPRPGMLLRKAMVVRLASDGTILWEKQYDEDGLMNVLSLVAESPGRGFLLTGGGMLTNESSSSRLLLLPLNSDGTPGQVTSIDAANSWPGSVWTKQDPRGYRILCRPVRISQENYDRPVMDAVLAPDGSVLEQREIDASLAVTWTATGGYFSVGAPTGGNGIRNGAPVCGEGGCIYHARTFDSQGTLVADRALLVPQFDQAEKVVQTADGGFAVLAFINNN